MLAQISTIHAMQIIFFGLLVSSRVRKMQTQKRKNTSRSCGNHHCFGVKQQFPRDYIAAIGRPNMSAMVIWRE